MVTITTPLPEPRMGKVQYECPRCAGVGETYHNTTRHPAMEQVTTCFLCDGEGWVEGDVAADYATFLADTEEVA